MEAWGGEGEEGEVKRILHGLEVVSELDEAFMFRHPVDLEEEPMYCLAVPFPTDLSTIRERLQNLFYRYVNQNCVNKAATLSTNNMSQFYKVSVANAVNERDQLEKQ